LDVNAGGGLIPESARKRHHRLHATRVVSSKHFGSAPGMVEIVCLEAALAFRNELFDIVDADDNDSIVFPHVDSCVAVIFLLSKGKARGGHVSVAAASGKVGSEESLREMLGRMLEWGGGGAVEQVIFVGHPAWKGFCDKLPGEQKELEKVPIVNLCKFNDPLDVFVDLGPQKLRVQKWVKDTTRHDTKAPKRRDDWLYDETLPTGR
jgi:hypothetical protein